MFWYKVHEWANLKALLRPLAEFLSQMGRRNLEWYLNQTEAPLVGEASHILETDLKDVTVLLIFDDVHKAEHGAGVLGGPADRHGGPGAREGRMHRPRASDLLFPSAVFRGLVEELNLEGLDKCSSLQMMRSRGLSPDVEEVFRVTSGHPLSWSSSTTPSWPWERTSASSSNRRCSPGWEWRNGRS